MRWRRAKFALFAVTALAVTVAAPVVTPARAAVPAETQTILLWRGQEEKLQPDGRTTFYVSVANVEGTTRPTGSVVVKFDGTDRSPLELRHEDPDDEQAMITDDFEIDLAFDPHYFVTTYQGNDSFAVSTDELGLATAELTADPEPSREGELVTYTFTMSIWPGTPENRRPDGRVAFSDDEGHATNEHPRVVDLKAEWKVGQRQGRRTTEAVYSRGTDFFQPIRKVREHNVEATPGAAATTTTTRRVTPTTARRTGTTAALAPINPSTTTTLVDQSTTSSSILDLPTTPPGTSEAAPSALNKQRDDGPPLVVVVTTLAALGVLGGIAAVRRYRRSAIDWL